MKFPGRSCAHASKFAREAAGSREAAQIVLDVARPGRLEITSHPCGAVSARPESAPSVQLYRAGQSMLSFEFQPSGTPTPGVVRSASRSVLRLVAAD